MMAGRPTASSRVIQRLSVAADSSAIASESQSAARLRVRDLIRCSWRKIPKFLNFAPAVLSLDSAPCSPVFKKTPNRSRNHADPQIPLALASRAARRFARRGARLAGLGRTSIYSALGSGELKSLKIGKRRLIAVEALRTWLLSHEVAP